MLLPWVTDWKRETMIPKNWSGLRRGSREHIETWLDGIKRAAESAAAGGGPDGGCGGGGKSLIGQASFPHPPRMCTILLRIVYFYRTACTVALCLL